MTEQGPGVHDVAVVHSPLSPGCVGCRGTGGSMDPEGFCIWMEILWFFFFGENEKKAQRIRGEHLIGREESEVRVPFLFFGAHQLEKRRINKKG
jgi:hypothetical protein